MDLLAKLFHSQKFIILLTSVIGLLITKIFKVTVDPSTIMEFVVLIAGWLISQGIADNGKGAAKVNAVAAIASQPLGPTSKIDPATALDEIKKV